jgi:hypothetical protein
MLDILVAEIGLKGARNVALVGQRKAAGVPRHVRVSLEAQLGKFPRTFHKPRRVGQSLSRVGEKPSLSRYLRLRP